MTRSTTTYRVHHIDADVVITETWPRRDLVELQISGRLTRRHAYRVTDLLTACILEGARHQRVLASAPLDYTIEAILKRVLPQRN